MSEPDTERRSFATTGFLSFLVTWGASLTVMLTNTDGVVRKWAAIGMVLLPALYLLCSTFIKRAKLKASGSKAPSMLGLASALMKNTPTPKDPGPPK